jgi:CDP-diacylglycerol--serine O-phosphatidyltransferase
MLRVLYDPANFLTLVGLLLGVSAIPAFISHDYAVGLGLLNLSLFMDHLDGIVARRTLNRPSERAEFGKQFGSYTDVLGACVAPAILLLNSAPDWRWTGPLVVLTIVVGIIRLSYFNAISFTSRHVTGIPITYTVPLCSLLFIASKLSGGFDLAGPLSALLTGILVLQLSPLRLPKLQGAGYAFVMPLNVIFAAVLFSIGAYAGAGS